MRILVESVIIAGLISISALIFSITEKAFSIWTGEERLSALSIILVINANYLISIFRQDIN